MDIVDDILKNKYHLIKLDNNLKRNLVIRIYSLEEWYAVYNYIETNLNLAGKFSNCYYDIYTTHTIILIEYKSGREFYDVYYGKYNKDRDYKADIVSIKDLKESSNYGYNR